jgi:hypothetical protein
MSAKRKAKSADFLNRDEYKSYVDYFNRMEDENVVQAIPNDSSWAWMKENIPFFDCPQDNFMEMYYYRWWTLRKHIKETPSGYAFTEFLVQRPYSDKYNLIACAFGHHIYEGRWLKDQKYIDQYAKVWYRGNDGKPMDKLHKFSSWTADALYNRFLVNSDTAYILNIFPDLEQDYAYWEETHRLPNGLYWQEDVRDGMEESISGGRKIHNARPTINSYMYGNAKALAAIARLAGQPEKAKLYNDKAAELKNLVQQQLWNQEHKFFETRWVNDTISNVREAIGYLPWYFNLPDKGYEEAWKQVVDEQGFLAPYGLTTAERRHPAFRTHGAGRCEWDGAIWPFASSQTLTAMANLFNNYNQSFITDSLYFLHLELYVESQYHRGKPYVGEYLDEVTGYWMKGDQERSRYYNHSTFEDLIITGLMGLRPRADNVLLVNPLIPADKWDWFCIDRIPYHGKMITIQWDKTGERYNRGKGFQIYINGRLAASAATPGRIRVELK